MIYAWSFSNNELIPIAINHNTYYISLDTHTTVFAWGDVNSNKTEHILYNDFGPQFHKPSNLYDD